MFQDHGENANGKLLRRFYEPLILLSVLDPTRGAQRPDLITDRGLQGRQKLWRSFLDQLSFLCDAKKGGDTVTAIAAQRTVEHTVFWLASNSNARRKAKNHVEWILSRLNNLYEADLEETVRIENDITTRCIEFSSARINTYVTFLLKDLKKARPPELTKCGEDKQLFDALKPFEQHRDNPCALCAYAYEFRRMEAVHILTKRHIRHEARGRWSDIRHNIGRLGCWVKAVKILLEAAQSFPQQLEGAKVDQILPRGPADIPPGRKECIAVDFKGLVKRMIPKSNEAIADRLNQSLDELKVMVPLTQHFEETYSTFEPRPHAELLVLEHLFERHFEFVNDDRYIGCSKPSCYCCALYTKVHPGRFEPRACHGNLWPNWAPPIPLPVMTSPMKKGTQMQRPQQHHTFRLLQAMVPHIRADVEEQIQSRRPRRDRLPDSTTGMSSVVMNPGHIGFTLHGTDGAGRDAAGIIASLVTGDEHGRDGAESVAAGSDAADDGLSTTIGAEDDSLSLPMSASSRCDSHEDEGERNRGLRPSTIMQDSSSEDDDGGVLLFSGRRQLDSR